MAYTWPVCISCVILINSVLFWVQSSCSLYSNPFGAKHMGKIPSYIFPFNVGKYLPVLIPFAFVGNYFIVMLEKVLKDLLWILCTYIPFHICHLCKGSKDKYFLGMFIIMWHAYIPSKLRTTVLGWPCGYCVNIFHPTVLHPKYSCPTLCIHSRISMISNVCNQDIPQVLSGYCWIIWREDTYCDIH